MGRAQGQARLHPSAGHRPWKSPAQNPAGGRPGPTGLSAHGSGVQPSMNLPVSEPGTLPRAGLERTFGSARRKPDVWTEPPFRQNSHSGRTPTHAGWPFLSLSHRFTAPRSLTGDRAQVGTRHRRTKRRGQNLTRRRPKTPPTRPQSSRRRPRLKFAFESSRTGCLRSRIAPYPNFSSSHSRRSDFSVWINRAMRWSPLSIIRMRTLFCSPHSAAQSRWKK